MVIFLGHKEPIEACPPDLISPDNVVTAAELRPESKTDACLARANDFVAGDQVSLSLFNPDAAPVSKPVITGDQVPVTGAYDDAGALVSSAHVASDLIVVRLYKESRAG